MCHLIPRCTANDPDAERMKAEFAALQGTWRCLRWEQEGGSCTKRPCAPSTPLSRERAIRVRDGANFKEGKLNLNLLATPNQVDAPFDGGVNRTIYIRSGDYVAAALRVLRLECEDLEGESEFRVTVMLSMTPKMPEAVTRRTAAESRGTMLGARVRQA